MRNMIGLIVLTVTLVVAVGISWSRGQVDPTRVQHVRVDAEPIELVEPVVEQRISVPVTVQSDGSVIRREVRVKASVPQAILQLESDSRKMAQELRALPVDESAKRQDVERRLRERLNEEFEARMHIEQDKVDELRERLKNVEDRLAKREENRQSIIDRRFAELTGDATLAWDVYSDGQLSGGQWLSREPSEANPFVPRPPRAPSSDARPWGRLFANPLKSRTETRPRGRVSVFERETTSDNDTTVQQRAWNLRQEIQDEVESLRESTSGGSAARGELDAALDLLHELKDRLDNLTREESKADENSP